MRRACTNDRVEYSHAVSQDDAPRGDKSERPDDDPPVHGWKAIDSRVEPLYPGQEPRHWGTLIRYCLGGPDPLDGISAYRAEDPVPHWHFVTYGFSELYAKESDDPAVSGFGFELTMRLARAADATEPPTWAVNFLQNLARYVFGSGNAFKPGDHMDLNGPISLSEPTGIVAIGIASDPQLPGVDTPNGRLEFLQVVGLTADEFSAAKRWNTNGVMALVERRHPRRVIALDRRSVLEDPAIKAEADAGAARDGSSTVILFNDKTCWNEDRGFLSRTRVVVTMGANPAREMSGILPGRIPHGRALVLCSKDQTIDISPGGSSGWSIEGTRLKVSLTSTQAVDLAARLASGVGSFKLGGLSGVVFEVVPSIIRDTSGKVVREVR